MQKNQDLYVSPQFLAELQSRMPEQDQTITAFSISFQGFASMTLHPAFEARSRPRPHAQDVSYLYVQTAGRGLHDNLCWQGGPSFLSIHRWNSGLQVQVTVTVSAGILIGSFG